MTALTLTRDFAFASGMDTANRAMRKANREKWSREDSELATMTTNRLLLSVPFQHGGLGGVPLTHSMLADLGLSVADALKAGATVAGHNGGPEA